jgi:hypothetical protein
MEKLVGEYFALTDADACEGMGDEEINDRAERARGRAEQVVSLLVDTPLWAQIRKGAAK